MMNSTTFFFCTEITHNKCQYLNRAEADAYLTDATGPVPDKVIPFTVVVLALVHNLSHQVVHGHAENRQGAQLMRKGLLLVR